MNVDPAGPDTNTPHGDNTPNQEDMDIDNVDGMDID
jgi:hypothetical protein